MYRSQQKIRLDTPPKEVKAVKEMVKTCIQCGTCTGSCPNEAFMDITPRKMWRYVLTDRLEPLLSSRTFVMCSSCYTCTLRCPRGLPLTEAMARLKQAANRLNLPMIRHSGLFYKAFLTSVRKHGRIRETELMTQYILAMKDPGLALKFFPLGMQLFSKKKIKPCLPFSSGSKLDTLFHRTAELEK